MKKNNSGFTLIELVLTFLVVGILSAVAIPATTALLNNARISATEKELKEIQIAIMGDHKNRIAGFRDNIGALPTTLNQLYDNSAATYPTFNSYTQMGWNGPYIESRDSNSDGTPEVLQDAWGTLYVYNQGTGTITSWGPNRASGGGDDIVIRVE
jgi:prepilin-type N-terminal cleavage/methylation domain-containing protein